MSSTQQPEAAAPTTVSVGCKLPNGIILELGKKGDENYRTVTLKGSNANVIEVAGGYGITQVDKSFMDAWTKKHQWFAPLKSGAIFVEEKFDSAQARGIEQSSLATGFERLDPNKAPSGITADPEHMKELKRNNARAAG